MAKLPRRHDSDAEMVDRLIKVVEEQGDLIYPASDIEPKSMVQENAIELMRQLWEHSNSVYKLLNIVEVANEDIAA